MEADVESTLKAALQAVPLTTTDFEGNAKPVTYRCWLIDDEVAEDREDKDYPCVFIKAAPAANVGHQQYFWDIPLEVHVITHHAHDPKRSVLRALYEATRLVMEYGTFTPSVVGQMNIIIDQAGESGVGDEENLQAMKINATVRACGVAA